MAHKKLKSFVGMMVREDGGKWYGRDGADKQQMYIETSGKMRLFMMVPDYVFNALGQGWTYKHGHDEFKLEQLQEGQKFYNILAGRDPEAIVIAWNKLCEVYSALATSVDVSPMIQVKITEAAGRYSGDLPCTGFKLEFARFLKNNNQAESNRHTQVDDYMWRDKPDSPLVKRGRYYREDYAYIPYDENLWAALQAFKASMESGVEKLQSMIDAGTFSQMMIAGTAPLQLSQDK